MVKITASLLAILIVSVSSQVTSPVSGTPVIGGACKLGLADVQIGGKQTQFFLKCESNTDSGDGQGVWVVKSRSATTATAAPVTQAETRETSSDTIPKTMSKVGLAQPTICEQDNTAKFNEKCSSPVTCLQANYLEKNTFLQCDDTSKTWTKKYCKDSNSYFSFENQACLGGERPGAKRQQSSGLVCTFASCSDSNPCSSGSCNNGYCCSSSTSNSSPPKVIVIPQQSSTCNGCSTNNNQPLMINICPNGGQSMGSCQSGYCSSGYSCVQNTCCPQSAPTTITLQRCPNGQQSVGYCSNNSCGSGFSCNTQTNQCCAVVTTTFVCSDGTQAAGACVSGQCGTNSGFVCRGGLCCSETTDTIRCLDGTTAIGACLGGGIGGAAGVCGAGLVCTTGNVCCPATAASICSSGGRSVGPCVNSYCPNGMYCDDYDGVGEGNCCTTSAITCSSTENLGPCINDACPSGHTCDTDNNWCCATYDTSATNSVGPCLTDVDPACPDSFVCGIGNLCYGLTYDADCHASDMVGQCLVMNNADGSITRTCPDLHTCSGTGVNGYGFCCPDSAIITTAMRMRIRRKPVASSFLSRVTSSKAL